MILLTPSLSPWKLSGAGLNYEKKIQKLKKYMKSRLIQVIKPIIEDKTAKQKILVAVEKSGSCRY